MADPKFQPYVKAITENPELLADDMKGLKEMVKKDKDGKAVAGMALERLSVVMKKMQAKDQSPAKDSSPPTSTSVGHMYSNQADLPRLPMPELDNTKEMLMEVLKPISTDAEWKTTEKKVLTFFEEQAVGLQKTLEKTDKENMETTWFHPFHTDMYMNARYPTYIYKNPVGVCRKDFLEAKGLTSQLDVAAAVVRGTIKFGIKCMEETLEPDEFKGITTCMLQYGRMFGSCRIPGKDKDTFNTSAKDAEKFFVVTRGGGGGRSNAARVWPTLR